MKYTEIQAKNLAPLQLKRCTEGLPEFYPCMVHVYLFKFFAGETNLGKKGHCEHRGCIGVTRPNAFIFLQKPKFATRHDGGNKNWSVAAAADFTHSL